MWFMASHIKLKTLLYTHPEECFFSHPIFYRMWDMQKRISLNVSWCLTSWCAFFATKKREFTSTSWRPNSLETKPHSNGKRNHISFPFVTRMHKKPKFHYLYRKAVKVVNHLEQWRSLVGQHQKFNSVLKATWSSPQINDQWFEWDPLLVVKPHAVGSHTISTIHTSTTQRQRLTCLSISRPFGWWSKSVNLEPCLRNEIDPSHAKTDFESSVSSVVLKLVVFLPLAAAPCLCFFLLLLLLNDDYCQKEVEPQKAENHFHYYENLTSNANFQLI